MKEYQGRILRGEKLKSYITFLGRSIWAVLNSYQAVLKEKGYYPELIHLIVEDIFLEKIGKTKEGLIIISEGFSITPKIEIMEVQDAHFFESGSRIHNLIVKLKKDGHEIAIDLTPGRKAMIAATLIPLSKIDVDHVFYLALSELKDASKPYEMIPKQIQSLKDFIEETR